MARIYGIKKRSGRRHMQMQLGIELKTREVISSPINSKGQNRASSFLRLCENVFHLI